MGNEMLKQLRKDDESLLTEHLLWWTTCLSPCPPAQRAQAHSLAVCRAQVYKQNT